MSTTFVHLHLHTEYSLVDSTLRLKPMIARAKELGMDDEQAEASSLREKVQSVGMPEEAEREALRELDRLAKLPPAAAEYSRASPGAP